MKVNDIIISHRIRKDLGDISLLKESIEKYGLLHPIIVDSNNRLVSGERRLTAIKELGWKEVDVIVKDLSAKEAIDIELSENTTRKDFANEELIEGFRIRHILHSKNIFSKFFLWIKQTFCKIFHK